MVNKTILWDEEKNQLLKMQRNICFDDVLNCIELGDIIARKVHPNSKYPSQEIFILKLNDYICYVPFVEDDKKIFLKTIMPSRKLNKIYGDKKDEK